MENIQNNEEMTSQPSSELIITKKLPGVFELLEMSWNTFITNWKVFVLLNFIVMGIIVLFVVIVGLLGVAIIAFSSSFVVQVITACIMILSIVVFCGYLGYKNITSQILTLVGEKKETIKGAWNLSKGHVLKLFEVSVYKQSLGFLVFSIIIALPMFFVIMHGLNNPLVLITILPILLVGAIVLNVVLIPIMFSPYVLFTENKKSIEAIYASVSYVKGNIWNIFVRMFLFMLIVTGIAMLVGLFLGKGNSVISILIAPFTLIYYWHLFNAVKNSNHNHTPISNKIKIFLNACALLGLSLIVVIVFALSYGITTALSNPETRSSFSSGFMQGFNESLDKDMNSNINEDLDYNIR